MENNIARQSKSYEAPIENQFIISQEEDKRAHPERTSSRSQRKENEEQDADNEEDADAVYSEADSISTAEPRGAHAGDPGAAEREGYPVG